MSYEALPLDVLNQEVVAVGKWWQCSTSGFIGDFQGKGKTLRGFCKVKPEPGAKLVAKCLMANQDRFITEPVPEFTAIDVMLENRDAVLEEKARNDTQDELIAQLRHDVDRLFDELAPL